MQIHFCEQFLGTTAESGFVLAWDKLDTYIYRNKDAQWKPTEQARKKTLEKCIRGKSEEKVFGQQE